MKNKLPNFLIVGAAKSGTSSLHNFLNQHPEVFMPSNNKEGMKVKFDITIGQRGDEAENIGLI